jgi:ornithine carbamoyltransferase
VPVLNALSSLWHPTQVLADLLTLHEHADRFTIEKPESSKKALPKLPALTIAYVGDSANVLHDMLVSYPRMGHQLRVASPKQYRAPSQVWDRVVELGCDKNIWWGEDPKEAVYNADVVVTDTW